jgi:hypothetical protein
MKSVNKKRMKAVGLFIIIAAIFASYYYNVVRMKVPPINTRESLAVFQAASNVNKVKLDFLFNSFDEFKKVVNATIETKGIKKFSAEERNYYGLFVYELNPDQVQNVITEFSKIGYILSKTENIVTQSDKNDLEKQKIYKESLYNKEFQDYQNRKTGYSSQSERIDKLRREIDSLDLAIKDTSTKRMTLLYVYAQMRPDKFGVNFDIKRFLGGIVAYSAIFAIIAALLYFGGMIIAYIFPLLGIKIPSFGGKGRGYNDYAGYKGYHGYGSYGYGGSKKRRVKRIYRNKHTSDSDSAEDKEQ